jgi:hypothetical protein
VVVPASDGVTNQSRALARSKQFYKPSFQLGGDSAATAAKRRSVKSGAARAANRHEWAMDFLSEAEITGKVGERSD